LALSNAIFSQALYFNWKVRFCRALIFDLFFKRRQGRFSKFTPWAEHYEKSKPRSSKPNVPVRLLESLFKLATACGLAFVAARPASIGFS
jgi:hypothetical protein